MSFAGWFSELPSGMSYRLWEQGGAERQPGEVALYTLEPDAQRRLEVAQRLADALRDNIGVMKLQRDVIERGKFSAAWNGPISASSAALAEWEALKT